MVNDIFDIGDFLLDFCYISKYRNSVWNEFVVEIERAYILIYVWFDRKFDFIRILMSFFQNFLRFGFFYWIQSHEFFIFLVRILDCFKETSEKNKKVMCIKKNPQIRFIWKGKRSPDHFIIKFYFI